MGRLGEAGAAAGVRGATGKLRRDGSLRKVGGGLGVERQERYAPGLPSLSQHAGKRWVVAGSMCVYRCVCVYVCPGNGQILAFLS